MFKIVKYDNKVDCLEDLKTLVLESYQINKDFFDQDVDDIKINFFYSREEMDQFRGYQTPEWVVGSANEKNIIGIFSPKVFDKISSHPASDFPYVLTHEIAHIFTSKFFKFRVPQWLREGLAGYIAKQFQIRPVTKNILQSFNSIYSSNDWKASNNYSQAYSFTKYLIDKFGKDNFLIFLQSLEVENSFDNFINKFKDAFKLSFSDVEKEWRKSLKLTFLINPK